MSTNLEKLQKLLRELFQLDQADLDFGIYRIMNHNRDEIVRFLENDLLPQVQEGFGEYEAADKERLKEELQQAIAQAKELGLSQEEAENTRKAQDLRQRIQAQADIEALEQEVYAHLYSFFRRYYQEGDFLSLRRYKEGVYAIPLVQGINRNDQRVLILWRNLEQIDNDALDAWFIQQGFKSDEPGFDLLYVNGDNNLENLRSANQTWRVLLIDAEFQRLMFDIQEV